MNGVLPVSPAGAVGAVGVFGRLNVGRALFLKKIRNFATGYIYKVEL